MALRLYNTLTRQKEEFRPLDPGNVRMYVCGPTVYDFAHIGNARPVIVFDVLFRLLRHLYGADHVTYVRNITDVDDKINARAARDFPDLPLNEAIRRVTEATNAQFQSDVKALGCLEPTVQPRATEHIGEMKTLIERLVEKGVAYVAEDHVLFSPSAMNALTGPRYGALSRRSLDELLAGARVDVASYKRDEMDFVLWKPSKEGEPGWPSPAGIEVPGRPGWHIECSAMAWRHLGEVFDIHAGGIDLIFPHHENEIAQSCCALGHDRMANVWMHNGFLQVEGRKMAKSEGNFVTINELLNTDKFGGRKWPGEVLRLAMLMTHYREPIDFSVRRLEEAEATLENWRESAWTKSLSWQEGNRDYYEELQPSPAAIAELSNDLGFSGVLAELHRLSKSKDIEDGHSLYATLSWLGLTSFDQMQQWETYQEATLVTLQSDLNVGAIRQVIDARLAFIREKNWAEADRIRDELLAQGIQLKDGKDPATGERVTTWEVKR